jgi:hypothetical protein
MLIHEGADVVFVARQLGHANSAITLRVYAHLFHSEAQGKRMRDALEARFGGNAVVTSDGEIPERTGTEDGGGSSPCALSLPVNSPIRLPKLRVAGSNPVVRFKKGPCPASVGRGGAPPDGPNSPVQT